jgi:capsular polysaccharide biosynthesis protein
MGKKNNDEIEIDLGQVLSVVLSKAVIIIMVGIIFGLAAFLGSKLFIRPTYESTTSLYVLSKQNNNANTTYNDLQSSSQLTKDYMSLVKSRTVTEQVVSDLGLKMTADQLSGMISVDNPTNTRILNITVTSRDQYQAKQIADKIATVSADTICDIMQIEKVNIIDEGNLPTAPASPNCKKNAIIAAILGVILTIGIIVVRFIMNDTIITSEDVEKYLGLSTLALIPISEDLDDGTNNKKKKKKPVATKNAAIRKETNNANS